MWLTENKINRKINRNRQWTEKVGTIMVVNRGKEKVRVHMNVVPRSTMNTNGRTDQRINSKV